MSCSLISFLLKQRDTKKGSDRQSAWRVLWCISVSGLDKMVLSHSLTINGVENVRPMAGEWLLRELLFNLHPSNHRQLQDDQWHRIFLLDRRMKFG